MNWDDVRVFLAVARTGTLTHAATHLKLGVATVTRRLDRLETDLGVKLFSRHQSGYFITDEGAALLSRAETLEQAGQAFEATEVNQAIGHVRLATAENLANPLIIPALNHFLNIHPDLTLEIVTGADTINLHRRDADLAIRMIKPNHGNVTLRRIGTLGFGLYGSTEYLNGRPVSEQSAFLESDYLIGWMENYSHLPPAQWIERALSGRPARLLTSSLAGQLAAASAGLGLAALPHFLARRSNLKCVLSELGLDQTIWLVIHSDLIHSRRVRAVADFIIDLFEQKADDLAYACT
ncbi:LysR family transcriptional regulator [Alcaligenes faecalis]|uniref:LysR family transcriptional regulator n=1 Tax=Alcaligenes faecalis TaxID=511 RepID=UPI000A2D38BB|nr:LysR family transcriptional regulator [Alcaligenes faecalis]KAA1283509.1 LysR family transcriptional regulator [Alcaligenes faecalis]OSZ27937.1 LysR family transcriptional regulator [Alcaligenes faecalis]OSZ35650.1 LysR family transcriptional regulator [Alcaligenes faecalis]